MQNSKAPRCEVGVVGLGVMGRNFAYNLAGKGFPAAGYDLNPQTVRAFMENAGARPVSGFERMEAFAAALKLPRRVVLLVPAGAAVDEAVRSLLKYLEPGDVIVDCGNSFYQDTRRREKALRERGIYFLGTGVSGGEAGALNGPSIMAGGDERAWDLVEPMMRAAAAKAGGAPCCARLGPDGAGHFVKMVHNGIEYADMQLIAESYFLLKKLLGLSAGEIADVFERWNRGELNSYLMEISVKVLRCRDENGAPLVDGILDAAGQKGTGIWTSREALSLGVPVPSMAEAVFARALSAEKDVRLRAAERLPGGGEAFSGSRDEFVEQIGRALYAFKLCAYAQGFGLLQKASEEYGWALELGTVAKIWRAGCIIRARFLDRIVERYEQTPDTQNLLFDPYFCGKLRETLPDCRKVVAQAALCGVPTPCFSSALAWYDGLRSPVLPANLIQAQRDFFGAHTYRRLDRPGVFHTEWENGGFTAER